LANILCGSPGVPASIIAFIAVAESTGTHGFSSGFDSGEETAASPLIGSSVLLSFLQAANTNAAVQIVKNILFIK
jgi:hypothetical protein